MSIGDKIALIVGIAVIIFGIISAYIVVTSEGENDMSCNHRDEKLDRYINKRVTVNLVDSGTFTGVLKYNEIKEMYCLSNVFDERRGFPSTDILFRKSLVKNICMKGGK
jgi:hypothetical protein